MSELKDKYEYYRKDLAFIQKYMNVKNAASGSEVDANAPPWIHDHVCVIYTGAVENIPKLVNYTITCSFLESGKVCKFTHCPPYRGGFP